jgi:hypothetical protein
MGDVSALTAWPVAWQRMKMVSLAATGTDVTSAPPEVRRTVSMAYLNGDVSHVVCFDGVYVLTFRDEGFRLEIDLFQILAVIASSSLKVEDDKDDYCDDRNASKRSTYGRCDNGTAFRYVSEMKQLRRV